VWQLSPNNSLDKFIMAIFYACTFALFAVASAGTCNGQDFACNHTDGKFVITNVYMESESKVHWKANDTVHIKMSGHVNNFDVEAGTLHYKVWEFGVEHFRTAGASDYFHCGPPPKPCNKARGLSLHLANPKDLSSNFIMNLAVKLPEKQQSGIMTIDVWGQDQHHEPYDFTSSILIHYTSLSDSEEGTKNCDGPDFACNHTDTKFAITNVELVAASGTHWKAKDTVTATFQGHLKGLPITAGTLHYKVWEFGAEHFRTAGALDYFHCGPPPKPCDKTKPLALDLKTPSNLNSGFTMRMRVPLPEAIASGTMTIDFWGEDQNHEPYDFTSEIRLSYKK